MRIAKSALLGSIALLALTASPALAKNTARSQTEDQPVTASCHSFQMAADGSWTERPCHEAGQTEHKLPPKAGEQAALRRQS